MWGARASGSIDRELRGVVFHGVRTEKQRHASCVSNGMNGWLGHHVGVRTDGLVSFGAANIPDVKICTDTTLG